DAPAGASAPRERSSSSGKAGSSKLRSKPDSSPSADDDGGDVNVSSSSPRGTLRTGFDDCIVVF
ncbi:hypothetical protein LNN38_27100, partial [Pseudomonas sp. LA21]|uniref:hypothetical protein n=1 Tax=Pseudomonas sp. LA21 TaxID=2893373 RepID=UPI001FB75219